MSSDPFEAIRHDAAQLRRQRADSAERVLAWARERADFVGPATDDVATLVRDLLVTYSGAQSTEKAWQALSEFNAREAEYAERLRTLNDQLLPVLNALIYLGPATLEEAEEVTRVLDGILRRYDAGIVDDDVIVPAKRGLEDDLLSLMLAAGYGRGGGHAFSKRRAATLVSDAARLHGFDLNVDSLCTRASTIERISKDGAKALQGLLLNSRLFTLRSIEQSKAPDDEPDT